MVKIGSRYKRGERVIRTWPAYEEMNPHVDGDPFVLQSALIGQPKDNIGDYSAKSVIAYIAGVILAVVAVGVSTWPR